MSCRGREAAQENLDRHRCPPNTGHRRIPVYMSPGPFSSTAVLDGYERYLGLHTRVPPNGAFLARGEAANSDTPRCVFHGRGTKSSGRRATRSLANSVVAANAIIAAIETVRPPSCTSAVEIN